MEQKQTQDTGRMIRLLATDIEGNLAIYPGLTKVKGISWAFSNAVCQKLGFDKQRKLGTLTEDEINKITEFISKKLDIRENILNRRKDLEEGEDKHLIGSTLELRKDFDIKRLKKIKSYRGFRHISGLPLRGQRTKSNFRKNRRKGAGIKRKK